MSVDFTTIIGYGYMLTWDEVNELTMKDEDLWDYVYCADCYSEVGTSDYFFGIILKNVPCGSFASINQLAIGSHAIDTTHELMSVLAKFGFSWQNGSKWACPEVYVINRVH